VQVSDDAVLWLWAVIDEDRLRLLREEKDGALKVRARVASLAGETFEGEIDFIEPFLSGETRTARARIVLPNPSGRLVPGMFARLELGLLRKGVIALPAEAVLFDEGRAFVFVRHADDFYVRRPVTAGESLGDDLVIEAGLEEGRRVVVKGAFLLKSDVLRSKMGAGCAD
jgi:cobalt-zinc-cadmium efflux system membrane fusion protein